MKFKIFCTKCRNFDFEESIRLETIPQDFIVRHKCRNGHNQIINLTNPLYSLLFDKCIVAYFQKNYRACIFEAASAMERFFEHAIRILIIPQKDLENVEKVREFKNAWKLIRNMSERQLGAFIMLFQKTTNQPPILLNDSLISIRNNTIHKGYLPTEDEARKFLGSVCDLIQGNRFILRPHNEEAFWLLDQRVDFENFVNPGDDPHEVQAFNGCHFFNSAFGSTFDKSLEYYYLEHLKV